MQTDHIALLTAAAALCGGILQAGALFFWAGKITQKSNDHDRRIGELEEDREEDLRRKLDRFERAKGASAL